MSRFEEALSRMPIVAILRGVTPDRVLEVTEVILGAGIELVEVPLNSPDPFQSISNISLAFPGIVGGAGTVTKPADLQALKAAGGQIVVAPNMNPDVIRGALALNMHPMPGVQTVTEAFAAYEAGARHLKLFPASTLGPEFVKALKSVLPQEVKLYAVGGAGPQNMKDWIAAGIDGFGIGSDLFKPDMSTAEIAAMAQSMVAAYQASR